MIKSSLDLRQTFHYAMGWRHLDNERYLGQFKATPRRKVASAERHGEGDTFVQHVRVGRGINATGRDIRAALANSMESNHCRHEHDCCGCAFDNVSVKQIAARDFVVRTRVLFNF